MCRLEKSLVTTQFSISLYLVVYVHFYILLICYFIFISNLLDRNRISVWALLFSATLWTEIVMSCTYEEGKRWKM